MEVSTGGAQHVPVPVPGCYELGDEVVNGAPVSVKDLLRERRQRRNSGLLAAFESLPSSAPVTPPAEIALDEYCDRGASGAPRRQPRGDSRGGSRGSSRGGSRSSSRGLSSQGSQREAEMARHTHVPDRPTSEGRSPRARRCTEEMAPSEVSAKCTDPLSARQAKAARKAARARAGGGGTVEEQLTAIYQKHKPEKLSSIPDLLRKYAGREQKLLESVRAKYGITTDDGTAREAARTARVSREERSERMETGVSSRRQSSCRPSSRKERPVKTSPSDDKSPSQGAATAAGPCKAAPVVRLLQATESSRTDDELLHQLLSRRRVYLNEQAMLNGEESATLAKSSLQGESFIEAASRRAKEEALNSVQKRSGQDGAVVNGDLPIRPPSRGGAAGAAGARDGAEAPALSIEEQIAASIRAARATMPEVPESISAQVTAVAARRTNNRNGFRFRG
eukprot:COSAG05_NODE_9_length_39734_cov_180.598067_2_plen_451_part_00